MASALALGAGVAGAMALAGGLAPAPAHADVKAGVDAWSANNYDDAIRQWRKPAANGDPDAQFNLAQAYKMGLGVERDLTKAEELYGKAAARGHLAAADNYGLLLFQRGERTKAMPFIHAASDRGDPRAQYVLGLSYFNGDNVPRDWVRAYALVSLAQQGGLAQSAGALAQMDQHIPLEDRQRSVALASELAAKAETLRASQTTAASLGGPLAPSAKTAPAVAVPASETPRPVSAQDPVANAARGLASASPATAGADYARPRPAPPGGVPPLAQIMKADEAARATAPAAKPPASPVPAASPASLKPAPSPASRAVVRPDVKAPAAAPAPKPAPKPEAKAAAASAATAPANSGWRVQLGAFGVPANADAQWNRVSSRPELAGHRKMLVQSGKITRLHAGGFASRKDADIACARLKSAGISCLVVRN